MLWEIEGARLWGLHAELGNRGSSYLIPLAWGPGNWLRGGGTRGTGLRIHIQEFLLEDSYTGVLVNIDTRHVSGRMLFDRGV